MQQYQSLTFHISNVQSTIHKNTKNHKFTYLLFHRSKSTSVKNKTRKTFKVQGQLLFRSQHTLEKTLFGNNNFITLFYPLCFALSEIKPNPNIFTIKRSTLRARRRWSNPKQLRQATITLKPQK